MKGASSFGELISLMDEASKKSQNQISFGLYNGHAGMSIIYYLLAKCLSDESFKQKGMALLNDISENISTISELQFENGLAGVGWAIEFLVQNELLDDTNTDDVLEEVDDLLYKSVVYTRDESVSLRSGTLGKMTYFQARELSLNFNSQRFRHVCHLECLVFLTDQITTRYVKEGTLMNTANLAQIIRDRNFKSIIDLGTTLFIIAEMVNISKQAAEPLLYLSIECTEKLLRSSIASISEYSECTVLGYYYDLLCLAICYFIAGKKHKQGYWQKRAAYYMEELELIIKNDCQLNDSLLIKRLNIYCLLNIQIPKLKYQIEIKGLISIISTKMLRFELLHGWGSVLLAKMSQYNTSLIKDWHRLIFINASS